MPNHHSTPDPARHALRAQLLDNGYTPLPLAGKGCFIRGWSRDTIDRAWLKPYARTRKYANTGLRCDYLFAFDIDVIDEDYADEVERIIERLCGPTEFCRVGQWPKRLLLYQADTPATKSWRSAKYGDHRLEILASAGRQFACYGTHPTTGRAYEWMGDSPTEVPLSDLPAVDESTVLQALDATERYFESVGLTRTSGASTTTRGAARQTILTPSMPFYVVGRGLMTVADIKTALPAVESWWCNLTAIREDSDSEAGHIFWAGGSGEFCIHDFTCDTTYVESTELDGGEREQLTAAFDSAPPDTLFADPHLADAMAQWVYVMADDSVRRLIEPTRPYTVAAFKRMHTVKVQVPAKRNPIPLAQAWLEADQRLRVHYDLLRPDRGPGVFTEGDTAVLNTYLPPHAPQDDHSGYTTPWWDFLEHLFPNPRYRRLFVEWLALKLRAPWQRQHAVLMVTPEYGTGRGTLAEIVCALIGPAYFTETTLAHLCGRDGQSQYTDYLANALLVSIPEARENDDRVSPWEQRHMAYERLKAVADTGARPMLIKTKYGRNITRTVYASLMIASNHYDAMAIEPGDRRLMVLENGTTRLSNTPLANELAHWRADSANIKALYRELVSMGCQYDPYGDPPVTAIKNSMVGAGESDIDRAWQLFFSQTRGDVTCLAQWESAVRQYQQEYGFDFPSPAKLHHILVALMNAKTLQPAVERFRIDGERVRPRILRNTEKWANAGIDALRDEILKNGKIPSSTVIPFPPKR